MSLSHLFFVFLFLPVSLILYKAVPQKCKNIILLFLSIIFIAWGNPSDLILIVCSILFNYFTALELGNFFESGKKALKNIVLFTGVASNLLLLVFFKYWAFLWENFGGIFGISRGVSVPTAPVGISFFTFSVISCLFDVSRGKEKPVKNLLDFALYVTFFPKVVSGPIVPYHQMVRQLNARTVTAESLEEGIRRFIVGLSKKVMLSNSLGIFYNAITKLPTDSLSTVSAWLGALFYSFMLYFDFSGYSDMAIGLGEVFGFSFSKNFDYPYISKSMTDFWRRWHISLGSWFRDYVYIPLGGSRCAKPRIILNLSIVWLLTGIWHGANWTFLVWGVYNGILLILEKFVLDRILKKIPTALRIAMTFLFTVIGWVIFFSDSLSGALKFIGRMFGIGNGVLIDSSALYYLSSGGILLLISAFGAAPIMSMLGGRLARSNNIFVNIVSVILFALLLVGCTACMISDTYTSFLYAQF